MSVRMIMLACVCVNVYAHVSAQDCVINPDSTGVISSQVGVPSTVTKQVWSSLPHPLHTQHPPTPTTLLALAWPLPAPLPLATTPEDNSQLSLTLRRQSTDTMTEASTMTSYVGLGRADKCEAMRPEMIIWHILITCHGPICDMSMFIHVSHAHSLL